MDLLRALGKSRLVHQIAGVTGVYWLANRFLAAFPRITRLPRHGVILKINSIAGFALREELFLQNAYAEAISGYPIRTLVDVGCNVGWFPCLMLEETGRRDFVGMLVDADKSCVMHAKWHMATNRLSGCDVEWGVLGAEAGATESDFYINPANTQSSITPPGPDHPIPTKGMVQVVRVPRFRLSVRWRELHGDAAVDLMKVDIEGAELAFLRQEADFLKAKVRRLACEWHSWKVDKAEMLATLESMGFGVIAMTGEDAWGGILVADNRCLGCN